MGNNISISSELQFLFAVDLLGRQCGDLDCSVLIHECGYRRRWYQARLFELDRLLADKPLVEEKITSPSTTKCFIILELPQGL